MSFEFTEKHLEAIRDYPHILGHMVGRDRLTDLHSNWIKEVWDNPGNNALQAHRGSYKTTAMEIGCLRWLLFHPSDRIGVVRKNFTDAATVLKSVKGFLLKEEIQALFAFAHGGLIPKTIVSQAGTVTWNFKNEVSREGNLDALGINGNLTGRHYDVMLLDDFVTLKDRVSKAERDKTKENVREIYTNIIDPGKKCIAIGTPWHKQDAWGLDAIPEPSKYDIHTTGLLNEDEIIQKKKTTTASLYGANYLLEHTSDAEQEFGDPNFGRWEYNVKPVFCHLDAKYSGDHTNALTFMAKKPDGNIQAKGFSFNENIKEKLSWVAKQYRNHRAKYLFNELNPDKGYTADQLQSEYGLRIRTYHESTNKHIKISSFLKQYWDIIIWDKDSDDEYMEQIIDYREGQEPDDAPDSAASLLREAFYQGNRNSAMWDFD